MVRPCQTLPNVTAYMLPVSALYLRGCEAMHSLHGSGETNKTNVIDVFVMAHTHFAHLQIPAISVLHVS